MKPIRFTPVEQRMINLLADGERHTKQELHACLDDELAMVKTIHNHIPKIRDKISHLGETIVCELEGRKKFYRHIVLLTGVRNRRCLSDFTPQSPAHKR